MNSNLDNMESISCEISLKMLSNVENLNNLTKYLGENVRIVWYFTKNLFGEEVSTNAIGLMRPEIDIIALPKFPQILNVWKWAKEIFKYSDSQAYFYEPFKNDEEEKETLQGLISYLKKFGESIVFKIVPIITNLILNEVAASKGLEVLNDNIWTLPDKSWLHKNIPGSKSKSPEEIFNLKFPEDINVPKGYIFHSFEELHEAKSILEQEGVTKFMIKDVVGAGGYFNWPIRNEEEYKVALKAINFNKSLLEYSREPAYIIQELLETSIGDNDICYTPIVHYLGQILLPGVYYQYCPKFQYSGMNTNLVSDEISKECIRQAEILKSTLNFKGPWGIDFVLDEKNKVYVIDINYGRMCGSHYIRLFNLIFADGQYCDSWYHPTNPEINSFYEKITKLGLNYDFEKKKGVIPLKVLNQIRISILCIGDNLEEVAEKKKKFLEHFSV
jgi:hypothetical protein